jgi:hypothetical protein
VDRRTVAWEGVPDVGARSPDHAGETGWRAFLGSWKWGAILVAACIAGLIAIASAHPFESASVSERVTDRLGQPSSCTEVGASQVADVHSTIYMCTVGTKTRGSTQCFAISGGDIKQLVGKRELGC